MAETATVEIRMPQMGESVSEGTVLEWHVSEGDAVEEGQTVVEVSTDKVDAEVPAPADGVIRKILAEVDETVQVGAALAELEPGGEGASGNGASAEAEQAEEPAPDAGESAPATTDDASVSAGETTAEGELEVVMPEMGESVSEGTILEWRVSEGDTIEEGQTIVEGSTDTVDAEVPAPASGVVTKIAAEEDETVAVGAVLAQIRPGEVTASR